MPLNNYRTGGGMLKNKLNAGFTLVELVVLLGILTIGAAVSYLSLQPMLPDIRQKKVVRNLKTDLNMARITAIRENSRVAVVFDTVNNSYTIFIDDGNAGGTANDYTRNGGELLLKTVQIDPNTSLANPNPEVAMYAANMSLGLSYTAFTGRGLPTLIGSIYTRNSKNNYRGVALSLLGRVQIQTSGDGGATWTDVHN